MKEEKKPIMGKAEIIHPIGEVERLRSQLAAEKERADAAEAALAKEREKWPHFCAMDHEPIASVESHMDERCPVCRLRDENAALTDKVATSEKNVAYWKEMDAESRSNAVYWRTELERRGVDTGAPQLRDTAAHDAAKQAELVEALDKIANGRVPPGLLTDELLANPYAFKSAMWTWTQETARATLDKYPKAAKEV